MAKQIGGFIKLQIKGGAANPSPPVGPALGSKGLNIMEFCKQFNGRTQELAGKVLPVVITYYSDKSFDFIVKTPPVAVQLMEIANVKKGSAEPNRAKVGSITWDQVKTIAEGKMVDLNAFTLESAVSMVAGTARSMGIAIKGESPIKNN
ncbi:MAG: 50S ribosomal protein L11 [Bacteroidales bacterium]|jgi:large subunit ribosomal protein L11|nr:50S ribosomal protein L11 [Bacteroidales bacterium]